MSRPPLQPDMTISGIIHDPYTQERVVPSSRRADGSARKELKIRPGYTPQEDVSKYKTARQLERERTALPKGSVVGYIRPSEAVEAAKQGMSKSAKKNAKRKEKKQQEKTAEAETPEAWDDEDGQAGPAGLAPASASGPASTKSAKTSMEKEAAPPAPEAGTGEESVDPEKRARAVSKRLRAAVALREKAEKGEKLLPEQQAKVDSIQRLEEEFAKLQVA